MIRCSQIEAELDAVDAVAIDRMISSAREFGLMGVWDEQECCRLVRRDGGCDGEKHEDDEVDDG